MSTPQIVLFDKLETIIDLLKMQLGAAATPGLLERYPEIGEIEGGLMRTNKILEVLVTASLPSAPQNVQVVTVGIVETPLASNQSQPLMRVAVTNIDVAQPLFVSKKGLNVNSGQIILPRQTAPFVLPNGTELYGIIALATIQVSVAIAYDMQPALEALLGGAP